MNLETYFAQRDTPAAESPVGKLIARIAVKYPSIAFSSAREKANEMLAGAARCKNYRTPTVYSESEIAEREQASAAYWKQRSETAQATA